MIYIFRLVIFAISLIILSPLLLLYIPFALIIIFAEPTYYSGTVNRGQILYEAFKTYKAIFKPIYSTIFQKDKK
jgi:hypothetical protein